MLIGYVSDERYLALSGVQLEFERDGRSIAVVTSTPRGAVYGGIDPGDYRVTLAKSGFGSKSVDVRIEPGSPYQFRMLSDCLLGYMWPKWARSGEEAEFRVHSVEPYRLSLWRYGLKKEFVRLLGWFDEHGPRAMVQITPDGDYTRTGVNWNKQGYGNPHVSQLATAPERSGLYYIHAKGESGRFFSFPWIVAPSRPRAPIAVLVSSNTWNAYNNFGGRSNYINADALPSRPVVNARQDLARYTDRAFQVWQFEDSEYAPLSFERPESGNHIPEHVEVTDPIEGRLACAQAPAEWRLLGWLEREGFSYDIYADYQLHSGQLDLDAYRVLILGVHPEYWSRAMYERVKAWVYARGGRLIYPGGNGINCEVEFPDEATMRCKTWLSPENGSLGMRDPANPDRWYDSRFHRNVESEANLLGVATTETGIMTAAPYRVLNASHWAFGGTGLRNGDLLGAATLHERCHGGASGHETDKMSLHTPADAVLLAKGMNPDNGGAEMVYYELNNGGAVFSAGSITYAACLLVDENLSRVTTNVLNRFLDRMR
jgi:N,N-dimethylformamidase